MFLLPIARWTQREEMAWFSSVFSQTQQKGMGWLNTWSHSLQKVGCSCLSSFNRLQLLKVEGEWDAAMGFLRQCREYVLQHDSGGAAVTTVHIHNL